jgi:threonine aldolase
MLTVFARLMVVFGGATEGVATVEAVVTAKTGRTRELESIRKAKAAAMENTTDLASFNS